jgi:alcohol dehydrogenase
MLDTGMLRLPPLIESGAGARRRVPRVVAAYGRRVAAIVDPFLAAGPDFQAAVDGLTRAGIEVQVHAELEPELPPESLAGMADAARRFDADAVLGWGGGERPRRGQARGPAAAVRRGAVGLLRRERRPGSGAAAGRRAHHAGTGSEVTPVAVVSDTARATKVGISSPYLIPVAAIVDPELSAGAPAAVTAHAGIDALVHAIESYTARPRPRDWAAVPPVFVGRDVLTDPLSIEAIRLIGGALETAVSSGADPGARTAMARGSLLAGMAFGAGTHLSHAVQYPIGALAHTPHGLGTGTGTGLMLPYVMALCRPAVPERFAGIADALGVADADAAIERVAAIVGSIGIPSSLAQIGVERADLPRIAALAARSRRLVECAPMDVDAALLLRLIEAAWAGDRSLLGA